MADEEHLKILRLGVEDWNQWREENPKIKPDLHKIKLYRTPNRKVNLAGIDFSETNLRSADLSEVNLKGANLCNAALVRANLFSTDLSEANLSSARLQKANLGRANLYKAILRKANLYLTDLGEANLVDADLSGATLAVTKLINIDLSKVRGLNSVRHGGPSTIGIDTLYKSGGEIPESFLRECGVPDDFIAYIPSLIGAEQAIRFYSCFISYSHDDEEFAMRLYSRMRDAHLRVWFAPEDIEGGKKLNEQIDRAIQIHDRLLIVLSENSLRSDWVMTEIRKARKAEIKERRQKLFPIRLVSFEALREWECFDAESGKDLATEVREYFIPDFSNWKNYDSFEASFNKLLKDLSAKKD